MSYARAASTASAKLVIDQNDAKRREAERVRISASSQRMMKCGMTCQEWLDTYLKRNLPATVVEQNTEATNDDGNGRETTGTEAGPVGAGEGVGDPPIERGEAVAGSQAGEERGEACREIGAGADHQGTPQGGYAARTDRLDDPGKHANWIDEAWPEGSQGADFTDKDRTPF